VIAGLADIEAIERIPLEQQNSVWTVPDLIARGAALNPDRPALHYLKTGSPDDVPETVSYRELLQRIHRAANLFRSLGVTPTDSVAILLPTVPQNYVAMLGAAMAGVAFPINWMLQPSQIGELLESGRSKVLVALGPTPGYDIWEKAEALRRRFGSALHILQVAGPDQPADHADDFDRLCAGQPATAGDQPGRDDIAFYIHTGGTTNKPKLAQIPHRCIAYKCWVMSTLTNQDPARVVFGVSPLFHVGGIVLKTITSLSHGHTTVIPGAAGFRNRNVIRDYWKLIERFRITDLAGVPTVLGALTSVPVGTTDISSLRKLATSGSSALPAEIANHFERTLGIRVLSDYGMTEATASVTLPPRDGPRKDGASGIRLPFTGVRTVIIDAEGRVVRDCRPDEIGEIIARGPSIIPGYVDPALNAGLFVGDGWIRSGDLGRLDADGYLFVTGRIKDLIIRSGHNIDPRIIEEILMTHEGVVLVAAVGKPDVYAGELPVAYVQPKPGVTLDPAQLKEFARARIPERAAAPVDIFLVDALPVTGVGKIYKHELRDRGLRQVISDLVVSLVPSGWFGGVTTSADPIQGTLVTVTLNHDVDDALERKLRGELGRFAYAFAIVWEARSATGTGE
jgi:fatty-acyl-CoA synthase